ncbi:MAG: hypothetical protein WCL04_05620 [Verrucomicrobiota bacterium]
MMHSLTRNLPSAFRHFSLRTSASCFALCLVLNFSFAQLAAADLPAAPSAAASRAPNDLGQGLTFLRLAALDDAVAGKISVASTPPSVALLLDLRGTPADEASATALLVTLRARPANQCVCLILISPATAPALLTVLASRVSGCLTLGRADGNCHPDIAVTTTAESDQRACDALAAGTAPLALLGTPADKPRHDEAELVKDHASGSPPTTAAVAPDSTAPKPAANSAAITTALSTVLPLPVDAVLQRAVQIHRGLLALTPSAKR